MSLIKPQSVTGYRFNKNQRLRKPAEFKQVYRTGDWGSNAHFSFNVIQKNVSSADNCAANAETLRLGITVSKKVSGLAVERNRIKRQVREFFRQQVPTMSGDLHADLIITARPACRNLSSLQLQQSLQHLWRKLNRWHQQQQTPNETNS